MKKLKLLLVEDNPVVAATFKNHLHQLDHGDTWELHHAAHGVEANTLLNHGQSDFALIFCDFNMPRMSGEELLIQVRDVDTWWSGYPVVIILVNKELPPKKIKELYGLGVAAIMPSPSTPDEFKRGVGYWLSEVTLP